jgi:hypothetical protein
MLYKYGSLSDLGCRIATSAFDIFQKFRTSLKAPFQLLKNFSFAFQGRGTLERHLIARESFLFFHFLPVVKLYEKFYRLVLNGNCLIQNFLYFCFLEFILAHLSLFSATISLTFYTIWE